MPHISLVFREMWDSTELHLQFYRPNVESRGIPHLAKNERDMGHPAFVTGRSLRFDAYSARSVIEGSTCAARQAGKQQAIPETNASSAITEM